MSDKKIRIVLTGGISGGHTFPLVAVAEAAQAHSPVPVEFLFIGSKGKIEEDAMREAGIDTRYILTGKWRRYLSVLNFFDLFKIPVGFLQTLWHILWFMPDVVFSKGGSASVSVVFVAWLYRIPIVIHDSDASIGLANRFAARFASRIAVAYNSAFNFFPQEKTALTGNPVRREITEGNITEALETFFFHADAPIILVLGGSQGAQSINEHMLVILPALLKKGYQIAHITGEKNFEDIVLSAKEYGLDVERGPYRPIPFLGAKPLADLYAASQVVISRAGAGSIAELAANKKATILVPLSNAANNEQRMNAYELAEHGAAEVLEEPNLTEHILLENIENLLVNNDLRTQMGEALSNFYHPDAADRIAVTLIELAVA